MNHYRSTQKQTHRNELTGHLVPANELEFREARQITKRFVEQNPAVVDDTNFIAGDIEIELRTDPISVLDFADDLQAELGHDSGFYVKTPGKTDGPTTTIQVVKLRLYVAQTIFAAEIAKLTDECIEDNGEYDEISQ